MQVDEAGMLRILLPTFSENNRRHSLLLSIIEEDIRERLERALRFANAVLNRIDRSRRLTDLVIVAGLLGAGWLSWRTRAEQAASPNSSPMGQGVNYILVPERPQLHPRSAFTREIPKLADDLTVLLRREVKG